MLSSASAQIPTNGLIYEFLFDNSSSATVGTGTFLHDGSVGFVEGADGTQNGALRIYSFGGSLATLTGLPYGNSARSISIWVNLINTGGPLFAYGQNSVTNGIEASVTDNIASFSNLSNSVSSPDVTALDTWNHFVFIHNGTTAFVYKNGQLIGSQNFTNNTINQNSLNRFWLGRTIFGASSFLGIVDELRIYNRALSAQEVSDIYAAMPQCEPNTASVSLTGCSPFVYNGETYSQSGNYIQVLENVGGCDSVLTIDLTISALPPVTSSDEVILCLGETYQFGTQTITTAGQYIETFAAANSCDSIVTLTVSNPAAELNFDPNTFTLSGSSDLSDWVLTHNGNFMGQASGNTLNVPNISMSGTYEATFGSTDCGLGTVTLSQVGSNLIIDVPSATPPIAANISWPSQPAGVNSTWQVTNHTYSSMGPSAYTLVMTDANGCTEALDFNFGLNPNPLVFTSSLPTVPCQTSASIVVDLTVVGIVNSAANNMAIYPNPFNSEFIIETTELIAVSVMNAMGEVVLSRTVNGRTSIDATNLSAGVYFVREETSGAVMKLVKN